MTIYGMSSFYDILQSQEWKKLRGPSSGDYVQWVHVLVFNMSVWGRRSCLPLAALRCCRVLYLRCGECSECPARSTCLWSVRGSSRPAGCRRGLCACWTPPWGRRAGPRPWTRPSPRRSPAGKPDVSTKCLVDVSRDLRGSTARILRSLWRSPLRTKGVSEAADWTLFLFLWVSTHRAGLLFSLRFKISLSLLSWPNRHVWFMKTLRSSLIHKADLCSARPLCLYWLWMLYKLETPEYRPNCEGLIG